MHFGNPRNDWWSLIIVSLQLAFDFAGRLLTTWRAVADRTSVKFITIGCYVRVVFLVLFPLMSLPQDSPVIRGDYLTIPIEIAFTFSQAYLTTIGFIKYQDLLDSEEERAKGAFILNAITEVGLAAGSFTSVGMM